MSASTEPVYLTPKELLARWKDQVSPATLATWRSRGGGPAFVKIGGKPLYRKSDVDAWETKNRRT